ncbi:unnamed protein product [Oncorhynchus mykiss]|uniref:SGNH hydrolase-type esterase domain-containing protein n=1 Tax=Oncorhynchus mykiss TaxID=8022 RepID=A0A060ZFN7_ONCMY|nr:unnamed protein product [Oncorhynchus mykiss]
MYPGWTDVSFLLCYCSDILREFNPSLTGFSVGKGKEHTPQAFLNQAVAGGKAKDIPEQVRALVARMKNDSLVNFQEDWKVITLFIGGNDMCDYCHSSLFYSTENYVRHIRESLDYLHKQVGAEGVSQFSLNLSLFHLLAFTDQIR